MGLLKQFLDTRKTNKQTALSLEEENKQLKEQIKTLETQLRQKEAEHAEEIAFIDREFLSWYNKQNRQLDTKTIKEEQPGQLDLQEQVKEDLEIGDLLND